MRAKWNEWMAKWDKTFIKGGSMRAPSLDVLCGIVKEAWDSISTDTYIFLQEMWNIRWRR